MLSSTKIACKSSHLQVELCRFLKLRGDLKTRMKGRLGSLTGRMLIVKCKRKGQGRDEFLLVNYHGFNNGLNDGDSERYGLWSVACAFFAGLADESKLPVLVGCDANIKLYEEVFCRNYEVNETWKRVQIPTYDCKKGMKKKVTWDASRPAPSPPVEYGMTQGVIDFVGAVCPTSGLHAEFPRDSVWLHPHDPSVAKGIFDHDPILAMVRITADGAHSENPVPIPLLQKGMWDAECSCGGLSKMVMECDKQSYQKQSGVDSNAVESLDIIKIDFSGNKKDRMAKQEKMAKLMLMGLNMDQARAITDKSSPNTSKPGFEFFLNVSVKSGWLSVDYLPGFQGGKVLEADDTLWYRGSDIDEKKLVTGLQARLIDMGVLYIEAIKVMVSYDIVEGPSFYRVPKGEPRLPRMVAMFPDNTKKELHLGENFGLVPGKVDLGSKWSLGVERLPVAGTSAP